MVFADPHACPSCAGTIAGQPQCPHCRFDLSGPLAGDIWSRLREVDALVAEGRRRAPAAGATAAPLAPLPRPAPPRPAAAPRRRRRVTTGSVILALGALCLVVAGLVFVTVSWAVLGPVGRTVTLLLITAAVAAGAQLLTGKRLRGSAETLWAVFFGLFTIDFFAGRAYGLAALDQLDGPTATLLFGVLAGGLAVAIALADRARLPLVVLAVVAGCCVWIAGLALAAALDVRFFWSVFAALALTATATAGLRELRLTWAVRVGLPAAALSYLAAVGAATVELADSPQLRQLAGGGHGAPMLVMVAVTIGAGVVVDRARIPAAALAVLGGAALLVTPAAAESATGGFLVASALSVVGAGALLHGTDRWRRGARVGVGIVLAALAVAALGWSANALVAVENSNLGGFGASWTVRLTNSADLPGPGWVALLTFGALGAAVAALTRWPELPALLPARTLLPGSIAGVGIVSAVIAVEPPVLVAAATTLLVGLALGRLARAQHDGWLVPVLLTVAAPVAMTWASKPVSLLIWLAVAAALAVYAWRLEPLWARRAAAFGATALLPAAATLAADMLSVDDQGLRLTAAAAALGLLIAAAVRRPVVRVPVEAAAGLTLVVVLASAVGTSLAGQSFLWTVVGAPLLVLGLLMPDRRVLRRAGAGALGVAWVLRLLASEVDTIEAYTAPFAAALLAAGVLAMRADARLRTRRALLPGLTLALLPSVPQALEDPTGQRALLLGVAALATLAAGTRLAWQAPFVFGAAVAGALVLWNVGPLAHGLPRWALIAVAGMVLVGVGITWESRVREARSAVSYVAHLR